MTVAAGGTRPANLADTFGGIDDRLRVVEYGDPHALREQLGNLQEDVEDWVRALLGQVMNDLYSNDVGAFNWCYTYSTNITAAHNAMLNYAGAVAMWTVHQHENVMHPPAPPAGTPPTMPAPPVVPPMWTVTYPDIPQTAVAAAHDSAWAAAVEATRAAVEAAMHVHEQDHPPPEEDTP